MDKTDIEKLRYEAALHARLAVKRARDAARARYALAALQGMCANPGDRNLTGPEVVRIAFELAELMCDEQFKRETANEDH